MSKRILVLGATGLLGKPVAHHLHEAGYVVRILARDIAKAQQLFSESFELVAGDEHAHVTARDASRGGRRAHDERSRRPQGLCR